MPTRIDANTMQLPTDLSYLHQLSEESERDNHVPFPAASDTPADAREPNQSLPPSSSSGSQLTSSDKPSALPSHPRPSPTGRSTTSLRSKSGIPEGSGSLRLRKCVFHCHPSRAPPYRSLIACLTVQWSGRHHHANNAFRLTVIKNHQLALAQTIASFLSLVLMEVLSLLFWTHCRYRYQSSTALR
ncbi:hypothetical protein EDB89DRAFT_1996854 [Lactarius sanguifluus]|nr:hypothetical protein EDB89DRAFT_1996854 [Lactarius sanguifluus]